jgi:hypothetical protein
MAAELATSHDEEAIKKLASWIIPISATTNLGDLSIFSLTCAKKTQNL